MDFSRLQTLEQNWVAAELNLQPFVEQCKRGRSTRGALAIAKGRALAAAEMLREFLRNELAAIEARTVALRLDGTPP